MFADPLLELWCINMVMIDGVVTELAQSERDI